MELKEIKNKEHRTTAQTIIETLNGLDVPVVLDDVAEGLTKLSVHLRFSKPTKISKLESCMSDLRYALGQPKLAMSDPISGKPGVSLYIPLKERKALTWKQANQLDEFTRAKGLEILLGLDETLSPLMVDVAKLPHLLLAGSTGSGKSVVLHSLIGQLMSRLTPRHIQFILVDPKRIEFARYAGAPHMLTAPITHPRSALEAFRWANEEMERRFEILSEEGCRDLGEYHGRFKRRSLPHIVIVVDELADIMYEEPRVVEEQIVRLTQMGRAAGIHLVVSTVRPSTDVITGLMKANIPARIAMRVSSVIDSRIILDTPGAEDLLGAGDGLYLPLEATYPILFQAAHLTERDSERLIRAAKKKYGTKTPKLEFGIAEDAEG